MEKERLREAKESAQGHTVWEEEARLATKVGISPPYDTALLYLNILQLPAQHPSALGNVPHEEQPCWGQLGIWAKGLKKAHAS